MFFGSEEKLNYISLFAEEKADINLTKVFVKKKHDVPGPTRYDLIRNWKNNKKGKFLMCPRKTVSQLTAEKAKRDKFPGPAHYKPKPVRASVGFAGLTGLQMQLAPNQAYYAMQTPGFKYSKDDVSD